MRILVLDDDKKLLQEVVKILCRRGHDADGIDNAVDAVPMAEQGNYDFILVDYRMPDHDGIWFMRNAKLPQHTKALLVTAHVDKNVIRTMFAKGVSGYVIKPFDEEELLQHLSFYSARLCDKPTSEGSAS